MSTEELEKTDWLLPIIRDILSLLGEDAGREGLLKTPERVAKAMQNLTKGYWQDPNLCCARPCSKRIIGRW